MWRSLLFVAALLTAIRLFFFSGSQQTDAALRMAAAPAGAMRAVQRACHRSLAPRLKAAMAVTMFILKRVWCM